MMSGERHSVIITSVTVQGLIQDRHPGAAVSGDPSPVCGGLLCPGEVWSHPSVEGFKWKPEFQALLLT